MRLLNLKFRFQVRLSCRHPGHDRRRQDPARVAGDPAGRAVQGPHCRAHLQVSRIRVSRSGKFNCTFQSLRAFEVKSQFIQHEITSVKTWTRSYKEIFSVDLRYARI